MIIHVFRDAVPNSELTQRIMTWV